MLKPGILTKVRKWITTDKTVSETGKWIADAKSIKDLADAVRRIVPIGTIISLMGNNPPTDYLKCDGTTYNIADYSDLADYFYAQFGSKNYFGGDGSTTFKVPDLRGEFLRGTGTNGHSNQGSGESVGIHQDGTTHPEVFYSYDLKELQITGTSTVNWQSGISNADMGITPKRGVGVANNNTYQVSDSYSGVYTSRPTNTSILYCIKYI